ncbi:MAG: efflux RND transporter periplasmic adaptor subunit [Gemmatimonadetes bacterium]|nr:efflux RND transporter periplasmic adaptor subunit [Gemmatimonadota bacterium]
MTFSRQTLGGFTVLLILAALTTGVYFRLRWETPEGEAAASTEETDDPTAETSASLQFSTQGAVPVVGREVRRDTLWISVTADGRAEPIREARVNALVAGEIRSVDVRESDAVGEGATLIRIDSTEYALEVARNRSEVLAAEAQYRQKILFDEEIPDPALRAERERFARSISGFDRAQVALEVAELALQRTRVRAPFAGRVADLKVVPGQFVSEGTELLTLVDLDPIKVEAQVLEKDLSLLSRGRRARVTFTALPDEVFSGTLETINPVVDPETGSARVTLHLRNPQGRIKPGMYARVSLEAQHFPDRILVPRSAVLERDGRPMLFVARPDGDILRSEWRYVTPGRENETLVEILDNPDTRMVEPGEIVLVEGHTYLIHDAVIRLEETLAPGQGRPGR